MIRMFPVIVSMALCLTTQAHAGLINFEFTVEDVSGDGSEYEYDFQFWIDIADPDYSSTLGFNSINVNIGAPIPSGRSPRPFGNNFIVATSPGFRADDAIGQLNFTRIAPEGPGFNFWQPTADDFVVRFTGLSSVLAPETPMTWNYFGRTDVDDNRTPIFGARDDEFLVASPVNALTDFSPRPDKPAGVPVLPSLPLLAMGLGMMGLRRRETVKK